MIVDDDKFDMFVGLAERRIQGCFDIRRLIVRAYGDGHARHRVLASVDDVRHALYLEGARAARPLTVFPMRLIETFDRRQKPLSSCIFEQGKSSSQLVALRCFH